MGMVLQDVKDMIKDNVRPMTRGFMGDRLNDKDLVYKEISLLDSRVLYLQKMLESLTKKTMELEISNDKMSYRILELMEDIKLIRMDKKNG